MPSQTYHQSQKIHQSKHGQIASLNMQQSAPGAESPGIILINHKLNTALVEILLNSEVAAFYHNKRYYENKRYV